MSNSDPKNTNSSKNKSTYKSTLDLTNAAEHNLKSLSLSIPHNKVIAITGRSGSGKSSLAFSTIHSEGQRRYLETFSPYVRQFFDKHKPPKIDKISGLRPTIAISQRTKILQSRSTVGTLTDINDLLKTLWGALAVPNCPSCNISLKRWQPKELAEHICKITQQRRHRVFYIGARLLPHTSTSACKAELERLLTLGFIRVFNDISGELILIEDLIEQIEEDDRLLNEQLSPLVVILERVRNGKIAPERVYDAVTQSLNMGVKRTVLVETKSKEQQKKAILTKTHSTYEFSETPYCPGDYLNEELKIPPPRPSLFTFNHPRGACEHCNGFGKILKIASSKFIKDESLSVKEGCIDCWKGAKTSKERTRLYKFCENNNIDVDKPWKNLSKTEKDLILNTKTRGYVGVFPWFEWLETKKYKMYVRIFISKYREEVTCPVCNGARLKKEALAYQIKGKTISDLWNFRISELFNWIQNLEQSLDPSVTPRSIEELFQTIKARLKCLIDLGLPYLTLNRQARTLSGGETQRVNLATSIGSPLVNTNFILDEPSVGLHPRDRDKLNTAIRSLQQQGNSVLVVEHDPVIIDSADHVIELGPEGGSKGGQVTFNDTAKKWHGIPLPDLNLTKHKVDNKLGKISIDLTKKTSLTETYNLKDLKFSIPLDSITCLTGVSGSGKSTLLNKVIFDGLTKDRPFIKLDKKANIKGIELIDHSPLAKNPRATIGTYTKVWNTIRDILATTSKSQSLGLTASSFSFNTNKGRCTFCDGAGKIKEEMQFLSDVYVTCPECLGERFQPKILDIKYKGFSVSEILKSSINKIAEIFSDVPKIIKTCTNLQLLGLGSLSVGHPLSELSGGEAQRLKLIPYITKAKNSDNQRSILLFDEPTTGLHVKDVQQLINLFVTLRKSGNTVISVAHHLTLISASDCVVDLGIEGGENGGNIVAIGSLREIKKSKESYTGKALIQYDKALKSGSFKSSNQSLNGKSNSHDYNIRNGKKITPNKLQIEITGARENNLKNVSVNLPLGNIVCLTGASGSGKSTIAYDIIHAESQHHFLNCLSPYARQFVKKLGRPNVESIKNTTPSIALPQHSTVPSAKSTVGTISEIYHYLRLLFAKTGTQYCEKHPDTAVGTGSLDYLVTVIKNKAKTYKNAIRILVPIIREKKGEHKAVFEKAINLDISEVRVDGIIKSPGYWLEELPARRSAHTIEFTIFKGILSRIDDETLRDMVREALQLSDGSLILCPDKISASKKNAKDEVLSIERACPICGTGYAKPDPEDFSFHSRRGRCPKCNGLGVTSTGKVCGTCKGSRLKKSSLHVKIEEKNIAEVAAKTPRELISWIKNLSFSENQRALAEQLTTEIISRANTLDALGLNYLSIDRGARTLSGGELQRLRLSTVFGSPLSGVLYILDEPSIGLHPKDNTLVLDHINTITKNGSSVLMIDHDPQTILAADHIIEVGPEGGSQGGNIIFNDKVKKFVKTDKTPTSKAINSYYSDKLAIKEPSSNKESDKLEIKKGTLNNISNLVVTLPLHQVVGIAGVSGSGKSTLVNGIIATTLIEGRAKANSYIHRNGEVVNGDLVSQVRYVDQKPIGANARSTPVSYLGIWSHIRALFAKTLEAKTRGWDARFFSYNSGGGKCSDCNGNGRITLEMSFIPNAKVICDTCNGTRYKDEVRGVRYLGHSIDEVLGMTMDEARVLFTNHRKVHSTLKIACDLGLGYITLGQPAPSLSGGESQRLKLTVELSKQIKDHPLYILDEPTTGLHLNDIKKLMDALHSLVAKGASVIIVEHEREVLKRTDHLIELGPKAGAEGGQIVFEGTYEQLQSAETPWGMSLYTCPS